MTKYQRYNRSEKGRARSARYRATVKGVQNATRSRSKRTLADALARVEG